MSVQKNTSNFLKHSGLSFTTVINQTMEMIKDAGALGIYCYLASKPENWRICNKEIGKRFNRGRDYIDGRMTYLKKLGLIKVESIRNEKGQICGWETTLINFVNIQNTDNQESSEKNKKSREKPRILKTNILVEPEYGKTGTTNKRSLQIKDKVTNKREEIKKTLSISEYLDSDKLQILKDDYATDGLSNEQVDKELSKIAKREKGNTYSAKECQKIIIDWLNRALEYQQKRNGNELVTRSEPKCTIPYYEPSKETINQNRELGGGHLSAIRGKLSSCRT